MLIILLSNTLIYHMKKIYNFIFLKNNKVL